MIYCTMNSCHLVNGEYTYKCRNRKKNRIGFRVCVCLSSIYVCNVSFNSRFLLILLTITCEYLHSTTIIRLIWMAVCQYLSVNRSILVHT